MNCSQNTGCSKSLVEAAIKGWGFPIRKMDEASADFQTHNLIAEVALNYGSRVEAPPMIYRECLTVMQQKFSHLGADEIREAYRANAAGELDTKGKGEMYGGEFNAANFTAVMAAYSEKRRKVIAAYTNALHEASEKAKSEARKEKQRREFEENFESILKRLAEKAESWMDCPAHLFFSCEEKKMINLTVAEKKEIFERAHQCVVAISQSKDKAAIFEQASWPDDPTLRRKVVARKIALWECVVMPMKMELI